MELQNEMYKVNVAMVLQNEDINVAYEKVEQEGGELINLDNVLDTDQWSLYRIKISDGSREEILFILGSPYSMIENCFILEDDKLKVLNDNYLLDIDLESLEVIDKLEVLDYSTGIEIKSYLDGYLVLGEQELLRLDENNNLLWSFQGQNLFTNDEGDGIVLEDDIIVVKDLYRAEYRLNSSGEELRYL